MHFLRPELLLLLWLPPLWAAAALALRRRRASRLAALGPKASRACHFSCALALVAPDGREFVALGQCPGTLLHEGRGTNGFGYDPLFLPDGFDKTFAELPSETKCTFSHRARAAERMRPVLAALCRA